MISLSRSEARNKIDAFFQKDSFSAEEIRKIKRLAMKHRIRLGNYRTRFCKRCYNDLKKGKRRITRTHASVTCKECGFINKVKIS